MHTSKRSIVLLSGGLDSAVVLAVAAKTLEVHALSFVYGQRHAIEIEASRKVATRAEVASHVVIDIDPMLLRSSSLTGRGTPDKNRSIESIGQRIPTTFVFGRNLLFLSNAVAYAGAIGASCVMIGVNEVDCSGYPDCRPSFIAKFQETVNLAVGDENGVGIVTPLAGMSKAEIVRLGLELGVDFSITSSCYDPAPDGKACGGCDACTLRLAGFASNGVRDPIAYRK